jgi:hypothetical protein
MSSDLMKRASKLLKAQEEKYRERIEHPKPVSLGI